MKFKTTNIYRRKVADSVRAAERARNMRPCTKTEAIAALASDYDIRGVVFNMAVSAGLIEWDCNTHLWQGKHEAARLGALEDQAP